MLRFSETEYIICTDGYSGIHGCGEQKQIRVDIFIKSMFVEAATF